MLRFFSPLAPSLYAHTVDHFDLSNCVINTPVAPDGTPGTLCGLAYPFNRGYRQSSGAAFSPPHGEVFDEIYFADFAHDDLKGIRYFDPEPPLAKLFIAAGEWTYGWWRSAVEHAAGNPADLGFTPFGWRWLGAVVGTLVVPLMYLLAHRLWPNRLFALAAGTLTAFDGMFFIQSRIGMIDIYPIFLILLAYYLFHVHLDSGDPRRSMLTLLGTGIAIGLAIAAKWIALAALASMLFILFVRIVLGHAAISLPGAGRGGAAAGGRRWGRVRGSGFACPGGTPWPAYLAVAVVALAALPVAIYIASWIPFFERGQFHTLADLWAYQVAAYDYHAHLTATHPYGSPWYSWPFLYHPVLYYYEGNGLGIDSATGMNLVAGMENLGNPWIWWSSLPCLVLLPYYTLRHRSYPAAFILLGFVTQYLPWARITRVLFLYHMFGGLIFMVLALAFVLATVAQGGLRLGVAGRSIGTIGGRSLLFLWLAVAVGFFVYFYPVWTGVPIPDQAYLGRFPAGRMWFPSWI